MADSWHCVKLQVHKNLLLLQVTRRILIDLCCSIVGHRTYSIVRNIKHSIPRIDRKWLLGYARRVCKMIDSDCFERSHAIWWTSSCYCAIQGSLGLEVFPFKISGMHYSLHGFCTGWFIYIIRILAKIEHFVKN